MSCPTASDKNSERKSKVPSSVKQSKNETDFFNLRIRGGVTYSSQAMRKRNLERKNDNPIYMENNSLYCSADVKEIYHEKHDSNQIIHINSYYNPQTYVYISCSCLAYPVDLFQIWKKAFVRYLNTSHDNGLMMALLRSMIWNNLSYCDDHIVALSNLVEFKEIDASIFKNYFFEFGQYFEDIESYKESVSHLKIISDSW